MFSIISTGKAGTYGLLGEDLRLGEEDLRLRDEEDEGFLLRDEEEAVRDFPIFPDSFTHLPDEGLHISSFVHVFLHGLDIY